jgi:hypothetical protein
MNAQEALALFNSLPASIEIEPGVFKLKDAMTLRDLNAHLALAEDRLKADEKKLKFLKGIAAKGGVSLPAHPQIAPGRYVGLYQATPEQLRAAHDLAERRGWKTAAPLGWLRSVLEPQFVEGEPIGPLIEKLKG